MRSKYFWLVVLALAILAGIISCVSSNTTGHGSTPILPDIEETPDYEPLNGLYEYEYNYEPEPEVIAPPDPGELDLHTETVFVAGRYAGFLTWGYFHHSAVETPVAFIESSVLDTHTGYELDLNQIIDCENLDKALTLLAAALVAYAPEAAPYLYAINTDWLTHTIIDYMGLRVLISPDIAQWDMGFVPVQISYEDLDEAFLLGIELGLREPPRLPMVALTFDDGPAVYTAMILDMLEAVGGRATFCVLGNRVHHHPDTLRRAVALGSEVIGHSWNHQDFSRLNASAIADQITNTSAAIEAITGQAPPPIFRAPFGIANTRVIDTSRELGYSLLHWSVDPKDWSNRCADTIYNNIMDRTIDGAVILLHDIHTATMEAMERVIPRLIADGFQLVTASELIAYFYGELEPGEVYAGRRLAWGEIVS
ncbi:MAG: polysaccharide deacetylase family protein [Defluviitaleaceae bacterium]|nr:polysaccharide deacetylase family protein [Defluviitaleaceae bacterium]